MKKYRSLCLILVWLFVADGRGPAAEGGMMGKNLETATFAGGCFWGVEKYLAEMPGVVSTSVGYTGGSTEDPSYEDVCTGRTGHAEAVEIVYDPSKISYEELLVQFFRLHDPTTLNRQGPDIGSQYRSAIFYHTPEQEFSAHRAVERLERSHLFGSRIVTEIVPEAVFYPAEDYHQKYLKKNPHGYCSIHLKSAERIAAVIRGEAAKTR